MPLRGLVAVMVVAGSLYVIVLFYMLQSRGRFIYLPFNSSETTGTSDSCHGLNITSWRRGVVTQLRPKINHDCDLLASGSKYHIKKVQRALESWNNSENDEQFIARMSNCAYIREEFSNNFYTSKLELDFPIAFELVVYSRPVQVFRLLKVIYRPHNLYCIHVDAKSDNLFLSLFLDLSRCLDNVFVASHQTAVYYKHYSILEAQLNCLEELAVIETSRWKYVINLVGTEVPLKTNKEIVDSLKALHGVSLVDSHRIEDKFFKGRFTYKCAIGNLSRMVYTTFDKLDPVPHNITIYKGSTHFALTRDIVEFILTNRKAIDFRNYLKDVWMPEESFYASLYRLPESAVHGGYVGQSLVKPRVVENVWAWNPEGGECSGKQVHGVCIITSADLNLVFKYGLSGHFFFNKYFLQEDPVVMDCAEKRLVQLNIKEFVLDCVNP